MCTPRMAMRSRVHGVGEWAASQGLEKLLGAVPRQSIVNQFIQ